MRVVFNTSFDDGIRAMNARGRGAASKRSARWPPAAASSRPSDDPLGDGVGDQRARASQDRLDAYASTADAASYRLGIADSVLSDVDQPAARRRRRPRWRRAAPRRRRRSATPPASELLAIRDALLGDINTQFQGTYLFSGSNVTVAPYATSGADFTAYQGDSAADASSRSRPARTVASTFDGGSIFQGGDPAHVLDALTTLAADVTGGQRGRHRQRARRAAAHVRSRDHRAGRSRQRPESDRRQPRLACRPRRPA